MSTATDTLPLVTDELTKHFGHQVALSKVSLEVPAGRIVGLLGRNGAGKTTLLNLASGLTLPTSGECRVFGVPTPALDAPQLHRLGVVQQEGGCLEWMTARQQLDFHASFYPRWDRQLEARLLGELELDPKRKILQLSTGDRQKLGILLGVCHRPSLLLLDEPVSALDPIVRKRLLDVLVEMLREDGTTIVISSHILHDVEKVVDWIFALHEGALVDDCALDTLQESFAEWTVTSTNGAALPAAFAESFVLTHQGHERQALLRVRTSEPDAAARFAAQHHVQVTARPLNLEEMFPLLTSARTTAR